MLVSGTTSGIADGQTVTVSLHNRDYTATVSSDTFSLNISSTDLARIPIGSYNITASVIDTNNLTSYDTRFITFDYSIDKPTVRLEMDSNTAQLSINISNIDSGTTWEYSTNSGSNWTNGSGSSFDINSQNYAKNAIQVRTTN